MAELTKVTIYTDGACSGNPGPGGWGAILSASGKSRELSGGEALTTNNRMELMAVIKSLELLTRPCDVKLYSDSAYVVNAFNQHWIDGWQKKGWVNSAKDPVANRDLWEQLIELTRKHKVEFIKVKGHADNEFNNRCDELAVMQSRKFAKES
jgi:ribonuclease HI